MRIELLGKPGCHLCEDAKMVVQKVCAELALPWQLLNIEDHPELQARYKNEIPVLLLDGQKIFKFRIDERRLRLSIGMRLKSSTHA